MDGLPILSTGVQKSQDAVDEAKNVEEVFDIEEAAA